MNYKIDTKLIGDVKRVRTIENRDLKNGIRLNRNERVKNFDNKILKKIFSQVHNYELGKYPDQNKIYSELSKFLKIDRKNFLLSAGIDGSLKSIFEILTKPGDKICALSPSYLMYKVYSDVFKTKLIKIGYGHSNYKLDRKKLYKEIKKKPKILFIPNPNQPIEDIINQNDMKKICKMCKTNGVLLVVDEAYHMFGSSTSINLAKKYDNVIILRTLSKSFGLPSIRFGYMVSSKMMISYFNLYRTSYETNFLTDTVVIFFLKRINLIKSYIKEVKTGRDFLKSELKKIGLKVIGGKSNFLLVVFNNLSITNKV